MDACIGTGKICSIAEELYDENKNKPLKDVSLDSLQIEFDFNRISDSFLLDKAVRDLITRFIKHNAVDPEVDNDFIKKCLKIGLYAIESTETADELFQKGCKRRIVYPFDRARYDYEDMLGDGFRHQGVFSQLSGLLDPTKIKDCKNADELDIYRRVLNTIMPMYIKDNYKRPSFDEDFFKQKVQFCTVFCKIFIEFLIFKRRNVLIYNIVIYFLRIFFA